LEQGLHFDGPADNVVNRYRARYQSADWPKAPSSLEVIALARALDQAGKIKYEIATVACPYCLPDGDHRWLVVLPDLDFTFEWRLNALKSIGLAIINSVADPKPLYLPERTASAEILIEEYSQASQFAEEFALAWLFPVELMFSGLSDEGICGFAECPAEYVQRRWRMLKRDALVKHPVIASNVINSVRAKRILLRRRSSGAIPVAPRPSVLMTAYWITVSGLALASFGRVITIFLLMCSDAYRSVSVMPITDLRVAAYLLLIYGLTAGAYILLALFHSDPKRRRRVKAKSGFERFFQNSMSSTAGRLTAMFVFISASYSLPFFAAVIKRIGEVRALPAQAISSPLKR